MSYEEALALAYAQLPVFHRDGRTAIKPGLTNTVHFCDYLGNPQNRFKCIHIAGTNGKGSTSHMLAAILQSAGYKVGLYTSPHLKNFTERIRVNGVEMDRQRVANFIERHQPEFLRIGLSFFELTVGMAFDEYARQEVDVAVVEAGLGGLLDSTNVVRPILSVITNVSFDHMDVLGDTLVEIASQKAGIIKSGVPVVVADAEQDVLDVLRQAAIRAKAPFVLAKDRFCVKDYSLREGKLWVTVLDQICAQQATHALELTGLYQRFNVVGVLQAVEVLNEQRFNISQKHVSQGLNFTRSLTGLKGRWQQMGEKPLIFCDTGHNEAGISAILECIRSISHAQLWIVLGCARDKEVNTWLGMLPVDAKYVFSQASSLRALPCTELQGMALAFGLLGPAISNVNEGLAFVRTHAHTEDLIVVCGSTYLIAELHEV